MRELIAALASANYSGWSNAAVALGEIGPAASAAVPALERLVLERTAQGTDTPEARFALMKIRGKKR
jgi:hypothetical protein